MYKKFTGANRLLLLLIFGLAAVLSSAVGDPGAAGAQDDAGATSAKGTLAASRIGVPEVEITVASADGSFSEAVLTGEDGSWEVQLPVAGDYTATINPDTLPEGVSVRENDGGVREFSANAGRPQPVLLGLDGAIEGGAEAAGASRRNDIRWVQLTVDGLKLGLILGMMSIGLSLIFGTTGLVNFAHGELVTLGAVLAFWFNVTGIFGIEVHLIVAAVAAVILSGAFGGLLNLGVWAPLRRRGASLISMLVVSIGLSIFIRYSFQFQYGATSRTFRDFANQRVVDLGWFALPPKDMWIIGFSLAVLIGVGLLLQRTRMGKAMRAVSDNRDLAESSGIDVERVIMLVWIAGAGLAGLGGILNGITESTSWDTGFRLLLLTFAATTLGGLGTAYGALLGSVVVGLLIQLSTLVVPADLKNLGALFVMIFILLIRPQGLLGRAERIG